MGIRSGDDKPRNGDGNLRDFPASCFIRAFRVIRGWFRLPDLGLISNGGAVQISNAKTQRAENTAKLMILLSDQTEPLTQRRRGADKAFNPNFLYMLCVFASLR
jgi:hypothetical protein